MVSAKKLIMTKINHSNTDQMGQPLDHRLANKRAHWQPWTIATGANKGPHLQPRTGVVNANRGKLNHKQNLHICTYNPQSISDLNFHDREIMLEELKSVKWDVVGLSGTQIKSSGVEILKDGHHLFTSGNEDFRKKRCWLSNP